MVFKPVPTISISVAQIGAAIDMNTLPGDVAALGAGEKPGHGCDLFHGP